jgi:class 3 adenylate cyclase/DNA-binding CsgD family transcriptional regulator
VVGSSARIRLERDAAELQCRRGMLARRDLVLEMTEPAVGTFSFLFTDIEGASLLFANPAHRSQAFEAVLRHLDILRSAVERCGGRIFESADDSVRAVFSLATDAVAAALAAQLALNAENWGVVGALRVKMGVDTGEVESRSGHYSGLAVLRCLRLATLAHGGQVLMSTATLELVRDLLPKPATVRSVGRARLTDRGIPERVLQLVHPDLPGDFAPLQSSDLLFSEGSLTPREREIAEFLAAGFSNREIAARLVLAVSTVERHVANILRKLNLNSRSQIAALASDQTRRRSNPSRRRPNLVVLHERETPGQAIDA